LELAGTEITVEAEGLQSLEYAVSLKIHRAGQGRVSRSTTS
jgi:hypothetical protein